MRGDDSLLNHEGKPPLLEMEHWKEVKGLHFCHSWQQMHHLQKEAVNVSVGEARMCLNWEEGRA